MQRLYAAGVGFPTGGRGEVVPIVPAAVVFDLGRGGAFENRPDAAFGARAHDEANDGPVAQGVVGAGTGARAGGLKGGVGSASAILPDGSTVGALVVVNAVGSCVDPETGRLYSAQFALPGELPPLVSPGAGDLAAAVAEARAQAGVMPTVLATTLAVLATDATLTKAQCAKVAGIGHDGLARAIRPVHTMVDGDTVFTLSTTARPAPDPVTMHTLLDVAGDAVTRAVAHAMLAAESVTTPTGRLRSYREAFPSAFD